MLFVDDDESLIVRHNLRRVGLGIDVGIVDQDGAVAADQIRNAFGHREEGARGADRLCKGMVAVREQQEGEPIFFGELAVLFRGVVGDSEDLDSQRLEIVPAVTQLVGLERSTGGVGLGIEEQQIGAALEVPTADGGAVVSGKLEFHKFFADCDHVGISLCRPGGGAEDQRSGGQERDHLIGLHDAHGNSGNGPIHFRLHLDRW